MIFEELTERGLRDGLVALADGRNAIKARLQDAEQALAVNETAVNQLRKIDALAAMFQETFRARLDRLERTASK